MIYHLMFDLFKDLCAFKTSLELRILYIGHGLHRDSFTYTSFAPDVAPKHI